MLDKMTLKGRGISSHALDRMFELRKIEDEYAQALGRLVVAAGWVEYVAHRLCWTVIDVEEHRGARITGPLAFAQITRMIRSVAEATVPASATEVLRKTIREAEAAMGSRNAMLHATWVTDPTSRPTQLRLRMRPLESKPVSVDEIHAVTDALLRTAQNLGYAREKVMVARADVRRSHSVAAGGDEADLSST